MAQHTGPQFDPQPGDTQTWIGEPRPYFHRQHTVVSRDGDKVAIRSVYFDGTSEDADMYLDAWSNDGDGMWAFDRPRPAPKARTAEDAYNDPQVGDTKTALHSGIVYTVTRRDGDYLDTDCALLRTPRATYPHYGMGLGFWGTDFPDRWVYAPAGAAPAAPKARTAEDARTNPQPGDTMKYAHDADVYTVTSTDADTVTCTVTLPRTNWSDSWGGDWTYTPGVAPAPAPEGPDYKAQAEAARADADTARKDARDALAAAEKAVALAERTAGTLETTALYLEACRAVMSPAQCAAVEVLVGLAGRA